MTLTSVDAVMPLRAEYSPNDSIPSRTPMALWVFSRQITRTPLPWIGWTYRLSASMESARRSVLREHENCSVSSLSGGRSDW